MSEREPTSFSFWWPTSDAGGFVMDLALCGVGITSFMVGVHYEGWSISSPRFLEQAIVVLFLYVAVNVIGWYFIFNLGRFVNSSIRGETLRAMKEAHDEKNELNTLRRRAEILKLKKELGDAQDNKT